MSNPDPTGRRRDDITINRTLYRIGPFERPIQLDVEPSFVTELAHLTSGWPLVPCIDATVTPVIRLVRKGDEYIITSNRLPAPWTYTNAAGAMHMLLLELITDYCLARPELFVIHAGAAAIDERLVVLPAARQAGKSTLIAALAAAGATIWADDAFPISLSRGTGTSLGIAPSPRMPWPETFDDSTRSFLDGRISLANEHFAYIALASGTEPKALAPLGTERPIGAFVLPEQKNELGRNDIELIPSFHSEMILRLINQRLGGQQSAKPSIEELAQMMADASCWTLRYHRADVAARYLVENPPFK